MTEDMLPCLDIATSELAHSRLLTENLLQRIEDLSGKIRSGLSLVEDTGATVSTLLNDDDIDTSSDVMMMSSTDETHRDSAQGSSTCRREENCQSKIQEDRKEDERGKDEEDEKSTVSPQADGDPKLIKALEKMRRLDKKLADLVLVLLCGWFLGHCTLYVPVSIQKEREVKERRRELEQQIMGLDCYPSSSNEDIDGDLHTCVANITSLTFACKCNCICVCSGVPAVFPIFPTQVLEDTQYGSSLNLKVCVCTY